MQCARIDAVKSKIVATDRNGVEEAELTPCGPYVDLAVDVQISGRIMISAGEAHTPSVIVLTWALSADAADDIGIRVEQGLHAVNIISYVRLDPEDFVNDLECWNMHGLVALGGQELTTMLIFDAAVLRGPELLRQVIEAG